jgi:hypothetical protein
MLILLLCRLMGRDTKRWNRTSSRWNTRGATDEKRRPEYPFQRLVRKLGYITLWWRTKKRHLLQAVFIIAVISIFAHSYRCFFMSVATGGQQKTGLSVFQVSAPLMGTEPDQRVDSVQYTCAPWLRGENRTIVLRTQDRLQGWDGYQSGGGYLGGEAYWTASLDYALKQMGFRVEYSSHLAFGNATDIERLESGSMHRVVVDGAFLKDDNWTNAILDRPDLMCKVRHIEWWQWSADRYQEKLHRYHYPFDPRRALKPFAYEGDSMSLAAFFVHSQVTLPPLTELSPPYDSKPKALLLDKECRFPAQVVQTLITEGFELHVTCHSSKAKYNLVSTIPPEYVTQIVKHTKMTPLRFAEMLRYNVSMVVGFGKPLSSPTPYEALANGAAFLHPIPPETKSRSQFASTFVVKKIQHRPLMHLGMPYIYNYEMVLGDDNATASAILRAAKLASARQNRFVSYIPYQHRLESVQAQVCANIIEADGPCLCLHSGDSCRDDHFNIPPK